MIGPHSLDGRLIESTGCKTGIGLLKSLPGGSKRVFKRELQVAISAARTAGLLCKQIYDASRQQATLKKDSSPVTVADYAAQAIVCKAVRDAFPRDEIVAEEGAAHLRDDEEVLQSVLEFVKRVCPKATADDVRDWVDLGAGQGKSARFWTLDPIDGTKGYLRGEQYAVSLALIVDGEVAAGVLCCPNFAPRGTKRSSGALFFAGRGKGSNMVLMDGNDQFQQIRVSEKEDVTKAVFCESVERAHTAHDLAEKVRQLLGVKNQAVRVDSQAKYALVASGVADVYLRAPTTRDYEEKIWDHAAGALVLEEAGGKVTDLLGRPLQFGQGRTLSSNTGILATNGSLHAPLLDALRVAREECKR